MLLNILPKGGGENINQPKKRADTEMYDYSIDNKDSCLIIIINDK